MIWTVVSKNEMEGYKTLPVFQFYREVIGKENIQIAVVDEEDQLDFVQHDDIVLLRSAAKKLVDTIHRKGIKTTAEISSIYNLANDKIRVGVLLEQSGILIPRQFKLMPNDYDGPYFVKPRYGGESFGISSDNICSTQDEVLSMMHKIEKDLGQETIVEEFIDGIDCTVACYWTPTGIHTHAIKVECNGKGGIQTREGKLTFNEYCSALEKNDCERICEISRKVCRLLDIRHHARIDFRKGVDGRFYLIDINLIPGLGPSDHFAKCLLLTENISYRDAIDAVLKSAS